jgi:hypothetical protein
MSSRTDEITKLFTDQPAGGLGVSVGVHEMPFRDTDGVMKIWRDGDIVPYQSVSSKASLPVTQSNAGPSQADIDQAEDERDVASTSVPSGTRLSVSQHVEAIMTESGVVTADRHATVRLRNVLMSRLRGIRDHIELKEILTQPRATGGIGLDGAVLERVLQAVNRHDEELHQRLRSAVSMEQPERNRVPMHTPIAIEKPSRPEPKLLSATGVRVSGTVDTARPVMTDIKFRPKLTGPVEELAALSIVDFRRLAPQPQDAIQRIFEKIQLLEEESFDKKIAGIHAWRRSEMHRIYIAIGRESMDRQLPIAAVIGDRQMQRQPYVTAEEFDAITELNSRLRKYHY